MIKCVAIDDEQHAIDVLQSHITKVPILELVYSTTNPIEGFQYVQQNHTDLIFLDIQMPELDGIQFLSLLKEKTKVIITTAYKQHALEGYEHNVTDYLLKPVLFDRFLKAVQRAINSQPQADKNTASQPDEKEFLFIKTGIRNKIVQVLINSIVYVESKGNYITFITDTGKLTTLLSLKELEVKLPQDKFVRIHNSFIVAVNRITSMEGNQILVGKQPVPVGAAFKKNVQDVIRKYIINEK